MTTSITKTLVCCNGVWWSQLGPCACAHLPPGQPKVVPPVGHRVRGWHVDEAPHGHVGKVHLSLLIVHLLHLAGSRTRVRTDVHTNATDLGGRNKHAGVGQSVQPISPPVHQPNQPPGAKHTKSLHGECIVRGARGAARTSFVSSSNQWDTSVPAASITGRARAPVHRAMPYAASSATTTTSMRAHDPHHGLKRRLRPHVTERMSITRASGGGGGGVTWCRTQTNGTQLERIQPTQST
jgi:hypothetical protein